VRLAARAILSATPPAGIGGELSGPAWRAGAMRPWGFSPLPVRPLRLSPTTATAGGRACVTPGAARQGGGSRLASRARACGQRDRWQGLDPDGDARDASVGTR